MHILPNDLERIEQVQAYIEKNFRQHFTYAKLAVEFHISERKLRDDFKKVMKKTIYERLTEVRIENAKELLIQTYKPVKAIAALVGYHESNLDKQFKKVMGMAPQEWRNIHYKISVS